MNYDREFHFLYTVLQKNHVRMILLNTEDIASGRIDDGSSSPYVLPEPIEIDICALLANAEDKTLYHATDKLERKFTFLTLPGDKEKSLLLIGPYLNVQKTQSQILELQESLGIASGKEKHISEYYLSLPIIPAGSPIFSMIDAFCELIWETRSFSIVNDSEILMAATQQLKKSTQSDDFEDIIDGMKVMEARYAFESELMDAVEHGQIQRENELLSSFLDNDFFEKRTQDPIRNMKNYCVITNTLLRKAAQKGGVHPIYINETSSAFAHKIEKILYAEECRSIICEMFRAYCRLVRKHSMQGFSLAVQKAVIVIDSDISANLSLSTLSEMQGISPGYLSAIFKRDTGKTVSEYIRERRMNHAMHLLATTQLQIQTVALYCGIMDLQYFSKIFKKYTGMTPKDYREKASQRKATK